MSSRAVNLDEPHFRIAEDKARSLGTTPEQYLQSLIDADCRSFDDILHPVRAGFDAMTDAVVDGLLDRAQEFARKNRVDDSK